MGSGCEPKAQGWDASRGREGEGTGGVAGRLVISAGLTRCEAPWSQHPLVIPLMIQAKRQRLLVCCSCSFDRAFSFVLAPATVPPSLRTGAVGQFSRTLAPSGSSSSLWLGCGAGREAGGRPQSLNAVGAQELVPGGKSGESGRADRDWTRVLDHDGLVRSKNKYLFFLLRGPGTGMQAEGCHAEEKVPWTLEPALFPA